MTIGPVLIGPGSETLLKLLEEEVKMIKAGSELISKNMSETSALLAPFCL